MTYGIRGKPLKPDPGFIMKQLGKVTPLSSTAKKVDEREKGQFLNENDKYSQESFFKNLISEDTHLLNSILKRKKNLMNEFNVLEKKKASLIKRKELLEKKHKELKKEKDLFYRELQEFKNEEKEALAEFTKDEEMLKNDLEYIKDESRIGQEISKKTSRQKPEKFGNLTKKEINNLSSLQEKEKELHDNIQKRLDKRYTDIMIQDMPGHTREFLGYIKNHRQWLEKKSKELESGKWDNLDEMFDGKKNEKTIEKTQNNLRKGNFEDMKKETINGKQNLDIQNYNHDDVNKIESLISEILISLSMDYHENVKKSMEKAKNIYINFQGNLIDKQRIYEELKELQKLIVLKNKKRN